MSIATDLPGAKTVPASAETLHGAITRALWSKQECPQRVEIEVLGQRFGIARIRTEIANGVFVLELLELEKE